jgi:hypothetical protein
VGFIGEDSPSQPLSTIGLVALLPLVNWLNQRNWKVPVALESSVETKPRVLVD